MNKQCYFIFLWECFFVVVVVSADLMIFIRVQDDFTDYIAGSRINFEREAPNPQPLARINKSALKYSHRKWNQILHTFVLKQNMKRWIKLEVCPSCVETVLRGTRAHTCICARTSKHANTRIGQTWWHHIIKTPAVDLHGNATWQPRDMHGKFYSAVMWQQYHTSLSFRRLCVCARRFTLCGPSNGQMWE